MRTTLRVVPAIMLASVWLPSQESEKQPKSEMEERYRVYRGDGSPATLDDIVNASSKATVTFLGESHNDAVAHYLEEKILRLVHRPDLALSLEIFETDVQYVIDEYLAGIITEEHFMSSSRAWKNYKADYRPLVEFAKERKMPMLAANAPRAMSIA